ncbi:MAG: RodZ domain-containing protein [candidate division Zixibacteria bacterium]
MSESYKKIGEVLKAARKEQNKALEDIAEATKIMEKHLRAIEEGNFELLPSPAYFTLFARSYAQNLGLDPDVIDEIQDVDLTRSNTMGQKNNTIRQNGTLLQDTTTNDMKKFGRTLIWLVVIIISVFAVFLIYNFVYVKSSEPEQEVNHSELPAVADPEVESEKSPIAQNINATPYAQPPPLNLRMRAIQDVWTLVIMDGDTVLNRELKAGEVRNWEAKYRYRMTLGISTAVELSINGKRLAPLSPEPRTIPNLEINQTNFEEFYPDESETESILNAVRPDTNISPINPTSTINSADSGAPGELDGN